MVEIKKEEILSCCQTHCLAWIKNYDHVLKKYIPGYAKNSIHFDSFIQKTKVWYYANFIDQQTEV